MRHSWTLKWATFFGVSLVCVSASVGARAQGENSELSASACGNGRLVVQVTQQVENDVDSRVGGYWGFDHYVRDIQVREYGTGKYCGVVRYHGQFESVGSVSPSGTGTLTEGTRGTFSGGYRVVFEGTQLSLPAHRTRGNIGTHDYACEWADDGDGVFEYGEAACPNRTNWLNFYFAATAVELEYWAWTYRSHGQEWTNGCAGPDESCPGTSGDITD